MHERILAAAAKLPREKHSFIRLENHPCIERVAYNPETNQYILHAVDPNALNHIVLNQSALRRAMHGAFHVIPPKGEKLQSHEITDGRKTIATIYTHESRGSRAVDFIHIDEEHFKPLVQKIFGSDKERTSWPIRRRTTPLPVEDMKGRRKSERKLKGRYPEFEI